jgi:hypothetical protein
MLTEGCSIRSVERLTEIRRDTIIALLLIAGQRCERIIDSLHDIPVTDVQADECWNFIYCKETNKGPEQADNDEIGVATATTGLPWTAPRSWCWPSYADGARLQMPWN